MPVAVDQREAFESWFVHADHLINLISNESSFYDFLYRLRSDIDNNKIPSYERICPSGVWYQKIEPI